METEESGVRVGGVEWLETVAEIMLHSKGSQPARLIL